MEIYGWYEILYPFIKNPSGHGPIMLSINENVLVISNTYFQVGSLFMASQGVMRNKNCGDVWNPAETKCTGKWEFWNGRHWEIDTTIATLIIDCQGKISLNSSSK